MALNEASSGGCFKEEVHGFDVSAAARVLSQTIHSRSAELFERL